MPFLHWLDGKAKAPEQWAEAPKLGRPDEHMSIRVSVFVSVRGTPKAYVARRGAIDPAERSATPSCSAGLLG